jgi:hypothetical protein
MLDVYTVCGVAFARVLCSRVDCDESRTVRNDAAVQAPDLARLVGFSLVLEDRKFRAYCPRHAPKGADK